MHQIKGNAATDAYRVYLRALEFADHTKTYQWRSDPLYQAGVLSQKRFVSLETEKRWIEAAVASHEQGKVLRFGIVLKDTDALIGMISLTDIDYISKNAEIHYWIGSTSHRGQGFIGEAMCLVFQHAFTDLGLERIYSRVLESNPASRRAGEKFGYKQEGILRRAVFKEGRFQDVIVYSVLRDEFYERYGHE